MFKRSQSSIRIYFLRTAIIVKTTCDIVRKNRDSKAILNKMDAVPVCEDCRMEVSENLTNASSTSFVIVLGNTGVYLMVGRRDGGRGRGEDAISLVRS